MDFQFLCSYIKIFLQFCQAHFPLFWLWFDLTSSVVLGSCNKELWKTAVPKTCVAQSLTDAEPGYIFFMRLLVYVHVC